MTEPLSPSIYNMASYNPSLIPGIEKVLIIGSGGLSIGQAGEFDYSGSQAIKALKEANKFTILINPNIATNQTSKLLADKVYYLPVTPEYITYIIEKEKPDSILLTFGGQTALNCGIELHDSGVFNKYNIKVLGTPINTLKTSEDRDLFAKALNTINIPIAESIACNSIEDSLIAANKIHYPVIVRAAFALGGLGSGFASNDIELKQLASQSLSLSPQILVEKSLKGWKEVEYEVVRDNAGNCITVCNMENFDPLGVHTGDSIVLAPSQTLSDEEFHMLRSAAIKIINHLGVVGECNVQYALSPNSLDYRVIEVNARLSRSSALASKATGYPLAYTAAKIALGYNLPELPNPITKTTVANFEPSLDYIVCKIPKWDLSKFQHVDKHIGSSMKSVGEVMAIGRNYEEAFQKALRQIDPSILGFQPSNEFGSNLDNALKYPTDRRPFAIAQALIVENYSIEKLHELTHIDNWFLFKLENLSKMYKYLQTLTFKDLNHEILLKSKKLGFSDKQIVTLIKKDTTQLNELHIREKRKSFNIIPFVKKIDTLAAEFPANTNYLYTTYNATKNDVSFDDNGIMVLGSGVYRIGSSVEFDWCAVNTVKTLREQNLKTIMINYNPETVSTDFDEVDKLYFEELSFERVLDIYEIENSKGCVISMGGQLPQNIALKLYETDIVNILGTSPVDIDNAENRHKFSSILDSIKVDQPAWNELTSLESAKSFANKVQYPVLIRPSYVLSGAAMNVVYNDKDLIEKLTMASDISPDHPVVMTKFIENAYEIDVDAVAYKGSVLVHAISEHVENAGIHSGDATLMLPPQRLSTTLQATLKTVADKVAKAFNITGPFNMQIIHDPHSTNGNNCKVIECNIRASRSFPFVSKVLGVNFIDIAVKAFLGEKYIPKPVDLMQDKKYDYVGTKVPQFSFTRLAGADPFLGVEMASTGEVAAFGKNLIESYWTAIQSTINFHVPLPGDGILLGGDEFSFNSLADIVSIISKLGYKLFVTNDKIKEALKFYSNGVDINILNFPINDKKAIRELFQNNNIKSVYNLTKSRANSIDDVNYLMRRNAIDFGISLFNEPNTAILFTKALKEKIQEKLTTLNSLQATIPEEVRSWDEFVNI
ncbi:hypothetical protein TBLA_0F02800 [Henningerozyma blattae CBS 6284]|uniref:Carbamoyl phosphate synthase arginine-specific large chain n=1 Tax=Henningerozyma blattae (strain ATCC 34711 / CBS 6284 / DSM 70876 / NBRC 10599 / NRRL Y-10934 / UCD 77-7) TaxID=1071380 RepID=I2H617_HENB6|nr:hypothetical protein TBLA_0F02800 [Tetrapisispora blattae CBS 6284]CCH61819.1 hypothetical protein TBLA_0F02800 [Tetrapisispora blattae CBS 6284]